MSRPYRPAPLRRTRQELLTDLTVFVLSIAGAYSLNVVGSLPGNEVLILPMLPLLLLNDGKRAFKREYFWFWILTGGWLLGTIIADTYFGSPQQNRLKGMARVVFFVLNFAALAILIDGKTRRFVIFAIGLGLTMFSIGWAFHGETSLVWKFGMSGAVAIGGLLLSSRFYRQKRYGVCTLIFLALGYANLHYGFRSQLVVQLVAGVVTLPIFAEKVRRGQTVAARQSPFRIVLLLALAGGAAYLSNAAIKYGAKIGMFDESLSAKFETQSSGDYGVLVGGRPETLVAIQAIIDNPILGHGSYPVDPKYYQLKQDIQYQHGYSDSDDVEGVDDPVIPTHSHLTMAWVESGILGGICWIYIFGLVFWAWIRIAMDHPPFAPLYSYLLVWFLWDILYSPFGSVNRIWAAFFILLSYHLLDRPAQPAASREHFAGLPRKQQVVLPRRAVLR
jgi:O-antigen ligase